jgi:hypothetical protein
MADSDSAVPPDARAQALRTLHMASRWRLATDRWSAVDDTLIRLQDALRTPDLAAFREASDDLFFLDPIREFTEVGGDVAEPAPPKIRERLNTLIHALTSPPPDLAPPEAGPG